MRSVMELEIVAKKQDRLKREMAGISRGILDIAKSTDLSVNKLNGLGGISEIIKTLNVDLRLTDGLLPSIAEHAADGSNAMELLKNTGLSMSPIIADEFAGLDGMASSMSVSGLTGDGSIGEVFGSTTISDELAKQNEDWVAEFGNAVSVFSSSVAGLQNAGAVSKGVGTTQLPQAQTASISAPEVQTISTGLKSMTKDATTAGNAAKTLQGAYAETFQGIGAIIAGTEKATGEIWNDTLKSIGISTINFIEAELLAGTAMTFIKAIMSQGATLTTDAAWNALAVAALEGARGAISSMAVGTTNVPSDMLAQIHQGEILIPKSFAQGIRQGDISISGGHKQATAPNRDDGFYQNAGRTNEVIIAGDRRQRIGRHSVLSAGRGWRTVANADIV
jgi:hypothetical protein